MTPSCGNVLCVPYQENDLRLADVAMGACHWYTSRTNTSRTLRPNILLFDHQWLYLRYCVMTVRGHSSSLTFSHIESVHDFLLVISGHLSSISLHFWDINPKLTTPCIAPTACYSFSFQPIRSTDPFEFPCQTYQAKSWGTVPLFSEYRVLLASVVLSQHTRVTDD